MTAWSPSSLAETLHIERTVTFFGVSNPLGHRLFARLDLLVDELSPLRVRAELPNAAPESIEVSRDRFGFYIRCLNADRWRRIDFHHSFAFGELVQDADAAFPPLLKRAKLPSGFLVEFLMRRDGDRA